MHKHETYPKQITLGLKEGDYDAMSKWAEELGITRNEWLRRQLFGDIQITELVEKFEPEPWLTIKELEI